MKLQGKYNKNTQSNITWKPLFEKQLISKQILVQPYLLAFKAVLPEYERVPSKDEPFNESFCAKAHVHSNMYPSSCDVISGLAQTEKVSYLYTRQRTGKVQ